jgi:hypothetical protein
MLDSRDAGLAHRGPGKPRAEAGDCALSIGEIAARFAGIAKCRTVKPEHEQCEECQIATILQLRLEERTCRRCMQGNAILSSTLGSFEAVLSLK